MRALKPLLLLAALALSPGCVVAAGVPVEGHGYAGGYQNVGGYGYGYGYAAPRHYAPAPRYYAPAPRYHAPPVHHYRPAPHWGQRPHWTGHHGDRGRRDHGYGYGQGRRW